MGQEIWSFVRSQKVCINFLKVSTADEVIHIDVCLTENLFDALDVSVIMVTEESESLGTFESELAFDASVELVGEGFKSNNKLYVQSSGGFGLFEKDDFDKSVDVAAVQVQIDGNEELFDCEDRKSDSWNFQALWCDSSERLINELWVVIKEIKLVSAVERLLRIRLAVYKSEE